MIRWAMGGLVALLTAAGGFAQTADAIREASELLEAIRAQQRPNPFGGAPVIPNARVQFAQFKLLPGGPLPGTPGLPPPDGPAGPRPIRPVYTLPGPPKLDRHGDPLPAGAITRYGTVRLRHGAEIQALGFTHDGKRLCSVSGTEDSVKMWDTTTGKEVARLNTTVQLVGLAKDGSVVLVDDTRVRVWLPATNLTRELPEKTLPEGANASALAVNPDGRSIAVATPGKILLLDIQTGKTLKELNLPGMPGNMNGGPVPPGVGLPPPGAPGGGAPAALASRLLYSPDGRWLLGNGPNTGVWLWDLRTGKRVRTYRTQMDFPDYAFSPDVTKIAVTGDRLYLYSLDSEEPVEGFKGPEGVPLFAVRFSDDGKTIFGVQQDATILPLDATTGETKDAIDAPDMNMRPPFALSQGGTRVAAIDQSGGIRIWDTKTGKGPEVERLPPLSDPGIVAGGKSVTVLDQMNKIHTFDLVTGAPGKTIELPGEDNGLPSMWDAVYRRAAVTIPSGEDLEVQFIDADTGKVLSKHQVGQNAGIPFVAFASANRDRAALFTGTNVIVVNPTTGKTIRSFNPGAAAVGSRGAISPDGRLVAVGTQPLTIWEVATGKKRLTVDGVQNTDGLAFSADGRFLAAIEGLGNVLVLDVRTGAVARRLQMVDADDAVTSLALSADGKRVATGTMTGRVTVFDVTGGETLAPFAGHDGVVTGLTFATDGKKLISTANDGTAIVWDVPEKALRAGSVESAVAGFDEAFRLLGSADAAQAQRGLDYLYRHPADSVKQAGDRMPAPAAVPAAKIAEHIADLASDDFPTREAAVKALEKLGGEVGPPLRDVVQKSPSAEARKLAAELIGKIDAPATRPDDLRVLRVVEAMENLGTPEARARLEKWAAGPAGHRLTIEAAAALDRLKTASGK